jgi:hypothetical protein
MEDRVSRYMDGDKRTSPRFLFSEPVQYGLPELTVSGSIAGNISLSGISLRVQSFVPVGSFLELQIHLGDSNPKVLLAKAQVVRVRELSEEYYEIGLQFIKDEGCIRAIGKYIKEVKNHG